MDGWRWWVTRENDDGKTENSYIEFLVCVSVLDGGIELDRLQGGKSLPICTLSSVCRG